MALRHMTREGPRLGRKEIYLPNFTLTLLRTPSLPPQWASFIVPLNFNKLDLRDYLYNVYNIEVRAIRSFIIQKPLRRGKAGDIKPRNKIMRPKSEKRMMVEMDKPFVWPEEPREFDAWDKKTYDAALKDQDETQKSMGRESRREPAKERRSIAEQAKALLEGKEEWKSTRRPDDWTEHEGIEQAEEVETHVDVPKREQS